MHTASSAALVELLSLRKEAKELREKLARWEEAGGGKGAASPAAATLPAPSYSLPPGRGPIKPGGMGQLLARQQAQGVLGGAKGMPSGSSFRCLCSHNAAPPNESLSALLTIQPLPQQRWRLHCRRRRGGPGRQRGCPRWPGEGAC